MFEFCKRKFVWAMRNKLFWLSALLFGITIAILLHPGPSDLRLRLWGMTLQVLGAYTVWHDLTATAREFERGSILNNTWLWLREGFGRKAIVLVGAEFTIRSFILGGRATARPAIDAGSSIEKRLADLERYVSNIDADLSDIDKEIRQHKIELIQEIEKQEIKFSDQTKDITNRLKSAMTGNYPILLFGAAWLFVGIVIATAAGEIAKILAGQGSAVWASL